RPSSGRRVRSSSARTGAEVTCHPDHGTLLGCQRGPPVGPLDGLEGRRSSAWSSSFEALSRRCSRSACCRSSSRQGGQSASKPPVGCPVTASCRASGWFSQNLRERFPRASYNTAPEQNFNLPG